jgi:thiol-disulfide isomerase/thioredoxin
MENIAYLENEDVNPDGSLKPYVTSGKPCIVMVTAGYCGYCKQAAPEYMKFSAENPNIMVCAVSLDGDDGEKQASKSITSKCKEFRGVPTFIGFNSKGQMVKVHDGARTASSLAQFSSTLK